MERGKAYTERRGTFIILSVAIVVIVVLVLTGIIVVYAADDRSAKVVLCVLIALIVLVGLVSFGFLECQKKKAERKRQAAAQRLTRNADLVDQAAKFEPSAPPLSNRTSWAYSTPFRYSQRSTLLAGNK